MNTFIEQLKHIDGLLIQDDPNDVKEACTDWRKRYQTTALAIAEPQTVQQVQAIVALCGQHNVALCTQGGNTGLVGGAVPCAHGEAAQRPHLLLRTKRLRTVLHIDAENLTLTASVGYTLHEIQAFAAEHGFLFPLSLASEGTCTLGGNLASNAGGVAVLRYGNARELCLGLEYINSQGELCGDLRGLRKNNTGYDLRHLLIGSEGTLGVITTACMKVFPTPNSSCLAWLHVQDISAAVTALGFIQKHLYCELSSYEWMNHEAIQLVQRHFPARPPAYSNTQCDHVLAEFTSQHSQSELLEQVTETLAQLQEVQCSVLNVNIAQSLRETNMLWAIRENISEAQAKEGLNVKHDVACAVSQIPTFHRIALRNIEENGILVRPILFGHLGDGNLHFNLSAPEGDNSRHFLNTNQHILNQCVHDAILSCSGTISAEHGIGQLKTELLKKSTKTTNYREFCILKKSLDPKNILNPGKLLTP